MMNLNQNKPVLAAVNAVSEHETQTSVFAFYAMTLGFVLFIASLVGGATLQAPGNLYPGEIRLYEFFHFITGMFGIALMVGGPIGIKVHDPRARTLAESEMNAVMLTLWCQEALSLLTLRCQQKSERLSVGDVIEAAKIQLEHDSKTCKQLKVQTRIAA